MDEFISKMELQSVSVSKWYDPDHESVTGAFVFNFTFKIPFDLIPDGYELNGNLQQDDDGSYIYRFADGVPILVPEGD